MTFITSSEGLQSPGHLPKVCESQSHCKCHGVAYVHGAGTTMSLFMTRVLFCSLGIGALITNTVKVTPSHSRRVSSTRTLLSTVDWPTPHVGESDRDHCRCTLFKSTTHDAND